MPCARQFEETENSACSNSSILCQLQTSVSVSPDAHHRFIAGNSSFRFFRQLNIQTNRGSPMTPIQHLVVIFQENISFDHYFGTYPVA